MTITKPKRTAASILSPEEIEARIDSVIAGSTADETEIVWLEVRRGEAAARGSRIEAREAPERTVVVRVLDHGRVGSFRTGSGDPGDLAGAVRSAAAQSRVRDPLQGLHHLPADDTPLETLEGLHDPAIARLRPNRVRDLLGSLPRRGEALEFRWSEATVAVFNSRKLRRMARVTAAELSFRCGRRPGGGRAALASRRLADLDPPEVVERARARHASGEIEDPPTEPVPVVLSPEAAIRLIDLLNRRSFSAKAYYDGTSFLREHLGVQVFDRSLNLRDDGTDPAGIPFPFDLEGTAKRPVELILNGAPKTPTLDQRQAAVLGLPATAHAIGGNDARAENLFLAAGELDDAELLAAAQGGLWIGDLDRIESIEPHRLQFRAHAVGVRRIGSTGLGAPLPDLIWEDSLLRALSNLIGLGKSPVRRLGAGGYLGGISAPALALAGVDGFRVAR